MSIGAVTVENTVGFPQKLKLKIELPYNPEILLLYFSRKKHKKPKTVIQKDTCILIFTAVLFIVAKIWKPPKCPSIGERIKKMWHIYVYTYTVEYYSAKHRMNACIRDKRDRPRGYYTKQKSEREDKCCMTSFTRGI